MRELIEVEALNPLVVFSDGGLDSLIEKIEQEARTIVIDISTKKGREELASFAYKIAQSKTALDKMGKELVSGWKEKSKKVDQERARAWDRLEALQKEVRAPLTEWENSEKERVAKHQASISEIAEGARHTAENWRTLPLEAMKDRLAEIQRDAATDWQEFKAVAEFEIQKAIVIISTAIKDRETYDAEQVELAKLRQEAAERARREHEERIAAEAAQKAKSEAEALAKAEAEKAEAQRLAILREKEIAEARANKAEEDRAASIASAERQRIAAEEKAKADVEAAAQRERDKIVAEQKAEADAAASREADKKHKAKINNEALSSLIAAGIAESEAKKAIEAIAKGQVPNIKIQY